MGILAAIAIPAYNSYVTGARADKAKSNCELIAAAIAHQHSRGIDLTASNWTTLGITNPSDTDWTYAFPALLASATLGTGYFITVKKGTVDKFKLYPKLSGSARWVSL